MARPPKKSRSSRTVPTATVFTEGVAAAKAALDAARTEAVAKARETIRDAESRLVSGYAKDLCSDIADGNGSDRDDDSLFRTLVTDESWSVTDALPVYHAASVLLEAPF